MSVKNPSKRNPLVFDDPPESVHETLIRTKAILRHRGRARGVFVERNGAVCLTKAIMLASGEEAGCPTYGEAIHAVEAQINANIRLQSVIGFNDRTRDTSKVIAVLDRAIEATA